MPTYAYRCSACGRTYERVLSMSRRKPAVPCVCGKRAGRDLLAEHGGFRATPATSVERWSSVHGCAPEQVPEMQGILREAGLAEHERQYDHEGRLRLSSRAHQKRVERALGMVNFDDY